MGSYSEYQNRELRGPEAIANAIILKRQYPGNQALSFLVVEGDDDKRFYNKFADDNKCNITIAYSKLYAIATLSILEQRSIGGILVIVDADFDILEGKTFASPNILFTDTHDLETMIIKSPALEKVLSEFGSENKIAQFKQIFNKDLRPLLLACGTSIGYLRWVSIQKVFSLKFENLEFSKFLDKDKLVIDETKLIKTVKDKSLRHDISDDQIKLSIQELRRDDHDKWHVCCGHDLTNILSIGLHRAIGTNNTGEVTQTIIEKCLRLAYENAHFQQTHIYFSIKNWEKANKPFVILSID